MNTVRNQKNDALVLGVDGGATRGEVAIADMRGSIIARCQTGPASFNTAPAEQACENIAAGILPLLKRLRKGAEFQFARAAFGMSGIDAPSDQRLFQKAIRNYFGKLLPESFEAINDIVVALYAGVTKGYGIALIAGTGSNCYGRDPAGNEAYAGGLVCNDEGSAYDIGFHLLRAASRSFDGRGERTLLEPMLCRHYGVRNLREVTPLIRKTGWAKREIASLAPLVDAAALRGDPVARLILEQEGVEICRMVGAVAGRLRFSGPFETVLVGSVLKKSKYLYNKVIALMKKEIPDARPRRPRGSPVMGAVRYALRKDR